MKDILFEKKIELRIKFGGRCEAAIDIEVIRGNNGVNDRKNIVIDGELIGKTNLTMCRSGDDIVWNVRPIVEGTTVKIKSVVFVSGDNVLTIQKISDTQYKGRSGNLKGVGQYCIKIEICGCNGSETPVEDEINPYISCN
ncbi:MAG: hypothetical protein OHK0022_55340 [Roseiflexaceae bacterium]